MVSACKEFIGWKGRVSLGGHSEELAALGKEGESERDSRHWKQHVQRCSGVAGGSRGARYGNVIRDNAGETNQNQIAKGRSCRGVTILF